MRIKDTLLATALAFAATAASEAGQATNEADALRDRCASCHDGAVLRAPTRDVMKQMAPDAIRAALATGKMTEQARGLSAVQIDALARALGGAVASSTPVAENRCTAGAPFAPQVGAPAWNGWGITTLQHRFQPAGAARLTAAQVPSLKLKWAFGFAGATQAYAQPSVVGGRIFVGSAPGIVYSLDAKSGCQYWSFKADAPVRTAITVGSLDRPVVYFGDQRASAYALDAATGALVWKTRVESQLGSVITGAPTLSKGKLYVPTSSSEEALGATPTYQCCRFRGSISALDAATGAVLWKTYTIADEPKPTRMNSRGVQMWGPSGAAVWSSPTVDPVADVIYITTGDGYSDPVAKTVDAFIAIDANTGRVLWSNQMTENDAYTVDCDFPAGLRTNCPAANGPDHDFGMSPILVTLPGGRGRALVAGQKSGMVHALDPDRQGQILWQTRVGKGGRLGGVQWGIATDGEKIYAAASDVAVTTVAAATAGAQRSLFGLMLLDPNTGGGLVALNPADGARVWTTPHPGCNGVAGCSPAQSAAVTAMPGVVFSAGLDGHLRAYATGDGKIIWDIDTKGEHATVNGVPARGGAIDSAGAVIVDGMLYVNSGYAQFGGAPGNVLLAFSIDGK